MLCAGCADNCVWSRWRKQTKRPSTIQYQWHKHTRTHRRKDEIKIVVYYTILTKWRGTELMIHLVPSPSGCFTLFTEPSVDTSVTRATRPLYYFWWFDITTPKVKRTHLRSNNAPAIKWKLLTLTVLTTHYSKRKIKKLFKSVHQ